MMVVKRRRDKKKKKRNKFIREYIQSTWGKDEMEAIEEILDTLSKIGSDAG